MCRARTFQGPRRSRGRMRCRSTSGGSRRRTGRLARSCRCDGSTARQPGCAGHSITSRILNPPPSRRSCPDHPTSRQPTMEGRKDVSMPSVEKPVSGTPSTHAPALDLADIQATILRPRPMPYLGTHVVLRIDDVRSGREFFRRLTPHVDSAAGWWNAATPWLSVGITYAGLEALGLPKDSLRSFPEAFRVGMAARARQLGDEGVNHPKNWDAPFGTGHVHVGMSAFSHSEEQRRQIGAIAREQYESLSGVSVLH